MKISENLWQILKIYKYTVKNFTKIIKNHWNILTDLWNYTEKFFEKFCNIRKYWYFQENFQTFSEKFSEIFSLSVHVASLHVFVASICDYKFKYLYLNIFLKM